MPERLRVPSPEELEIRSGDDVIYYHWILGIIKAKVLFCIGSSGVQIEFDAGTGDNYFNTCYTDAGRLKKIRKR